MNRPNIIFITWHDLGDWLGCYGYEHIASPRLDAFAGEGVRFTSSFCTAPQCSASRSSIVTGLMPHTSGVMGQVHHGFSIHEDRPTLPRLLREAGYSTHLFGMLHESTNPAAIGYEDIRRESPRAACVAAQAEQFLSERHEKPFFLALGTKEVHRPFGEQYDAELARRLTVPPWLPDLPVIRRDIATFYRNITHADTQMGRVLDAVDRAGLREDTLVVFTTDHGPDFPLAKITMYDPGLKTALLMRWPGVIEAGVQRDELISNVDLLPAVLDFAGVEQPRCHGRSFAPLLTGANYKARERIFAEMTWHGQWFPHRAIRTRSHKYIINYCPGVPAMVGPGPINRYGQEEIEQRFAEPLPVQQLFDLRSDPLERRNLAVDADRAELRERLRADLLGRLNETDDPLVREDIPLPKPTQVNRNMWTLRGGRYRLTVPEYWKNCKP